MSSSNHPPKSLYSLRCFVLALAGGLFLQTGTLQAQIAKEPPSREEKLEKGVFVNFLHDEKDIVTSPLHLHKRDLFWLAPAAAITGEMLHRDAYLYRKLTPAVNTGSRSKTFTDAAVVGMGGAIAGMYFLGRLHQSDHMREASVLATEALADSMAFNTALKYTARRERPFNGNGRGDFFVSGGDSFASGHAIAAWSMATVVAQEYPGILTKLGAYGLATAVSVARVTGRQHFPTDVVVGSALGYGIGRMVYRNRHDEDLPGEDIGVVHREETDMEYFASPYIPLESWIYGAVDRLTALGFAETAFLGTRPWTEIECARMIREIATTRLEKDKSDPEAEHILNDLEREFPNESEWVDGQPKSRIGIDSLYSRVTGIVGRPLTDGYHFGETIYNDYGRPYQQGFNAIAGFSGSATHHHLLAYLRGEYQHAPFFGTLAPSAQAAIATADGTPVRSGVTGMTNRLRFLDAYAGFNFDNWEITFGKQSLWWGVNESSAFMFSNNAEPVTMLRASRTAPITLPSFLSLLGSVRGDLFFGQLAGHKFVQTETSKGSVLFTAPFRSPFIEGVRLSFKPSANLEFGISVTNVFGGPGFPITAQTFLRSLQLSNTAPGFSSDPGDRRSSFDFRYRIPGLRDWLTLYNDSFSEDEFSPIGYPRRSAMNPGIYLTKIPKAPKFDLRVEGIYTDLPNLRNVGNFYYNSRYLSGYTNDGNIIGSWIGRAGTGINLISTFWYSARDTIKVSYRDIRVSKLFIPGGGRQQDFLVRSEWTIKPRMTAAISAQYENWKFPVLKPGSQSDFVTSFQFTYAPGRQKAR